MNNSIEIWAVSAFIESRLQQESIDYKELEQAVGFSYAYIRRYFAKITGEPLAAYIKKRKIANAAFSLVHTEYSILDISMSFGFSNPDTFTKVFKRYVGVTPSEFRKERRKVGRGHLCSGVFGIVLEEDVMNTTIQNEKIRLENEGSVVLYGVPRAGYGTYGSCTPYPICLKSCLNYLGEEADMAETLVYSGAAFRMNWKPNEWDGGNVDAQLTYDEPEKLYETGVKAFGRKFEILKRSSDTSKEAFKEFICRNIDQGYPCLATGIIGPPEVCIITGYREDGDILLGWNFFQDMADFSASVQKDESGYFVSSDWWKNEYTQYVFSIGEQKTNRYGIKEVISQAVEVLSGREYDGYVKGIDAYDAWKADMTDDAAFTAEMLLPALAVVMMCFGDAVDCLMDGRYYAAEYFEKLAQQELAFQAEYREIANAFRKVNEYARQMIASIGGRQGEEQMRMLEKPEVRKDIGRLIDQAKRMDEKALGIMRELLTKMK